jgi:hypothetical protein
MEQLFESLDIDLNEETKTKLAEAFDKAVMSKTVELMDEHVETKVNEAKEVLEEEYQEKIENLEDSLDGYLQSLVEEFIQENQPVYESQINEEKTKTLLEMFDAMLKVAGVQMLDINEAHSEYHDENDASAKLDRLEEKYNDISEKLVETRREADEFLKGGVILEMKQGLSMLEAEKFAKLAEMVTFSRDEAFVNSLETIKESIIEQRTEENKMDESFDGKLPETAYVEKKVDVKAATNFGQYI